MSNIRVRKIQHTEEYARNLLRYGRRVNTYDYTTNDNHFNTLHEIIYRNISYFIHMIDGTIIECWHVR